MESSKTLLIVALVVGAILGYLIAPSADVIEETTVTSTDTVLVKDTVYVDVIKPVVMSAVPETFETVEVDGDTLVKTTQVFEMENFDVRVDAYAKCPVELIDIELLNIKPMPIEIEKEIITVEKLKTVVIEPAWHSTRTAGIIIGALGTITVVWATGQLVGN
jgi:hypothetical protein